MHLQYLGVTPSITEVAITSLYPAIVCFNSMSMRSYGRRWHQAGPTLRTLVQFGVNAGFEMHPSHLSTE